MAVLGPQDTLSIWVSSSVCFKAQKCWWEGTSKGLLTNLLVSTGWKVGISPRYLENGVPMGCPFSQQQKPSGEMAYRTWMLMRCHLTRGHVVPAGSHLGDGKTNVALQSGPASPKESFHNWFSGKPVSSVAFCWPWCWDASCMLAVSTSARHVGSIKAHYAK